MSDLNVSAIKTEKKAENRIRKVLSIKIKMAKEAFLEWSSRTDMNNYGKIFEYKGNIWAQIIWTIIFLVLSGLTVLLIQQSISAYLSYSVTSKHETIYQSPAEFPTITICAGNAFLTGNSIWLFNELAYNKSLNNFTIKDLIKLAKMYAANPSHEDENRKKLDLSIN